MAKGEKKKGLSNKLLIIILGVIILIAIIAIIVQMT